MSGRERSAWRYPDSCPPQRVFACAAGSHSSMVDVATPSPTWTASSGDAWAMSVAPAEPDRAVRRDQLPRRPEEAKAGHLCCGHAPGICLRRTGLGSAILGTPDEQKYLPSPDALFLALPGGAMANPATGAPKDGRHRPSLTPLRAAPHLKNVPNGTSPAIPKRNTRCALPSRAVLTYHVPFRKMARSARPSPSQSNARG